MYVCKVVNKSPAVPELVVGDRFRVEHVIGNLVSNAIKFSPAGSGIVVDVSVENLTSKQATILLVVKVLLVCMHVCMCVRPNLSLGTCMYVCSP